MAAECHSARRIAVRGHDRVGSRQHGAEPGEPTSGPTCEPPRPLAQLSFVAHEVVCERLGGSPPVILTFLQVLGSPMGPAGSPPGGAMMSGMAGGGSALSPSQCLGQQAFGEGGASKGYVQQGVYGRGGYGGPGFAAG